MKVVIAGGLGFLGAPLAEAYAEEGHEVLVLTRSLPSGEARHDPGTGVPGITRLGLGGGRQRSARGRPRSTAPTRVVNLAGEALDKGRWSPQRKAQLRDSRILATRSLAAAILSAAAPPRVFVSGSAVGFYGDTGDAHGHRGVSAWNRLPGAALRRLGRRKRAARSPLGTRLVLLRTGIALERTGGALPKMILPFKLFVGGPLGSGRQYFSWIHRLDWVETGPLDHPDAGGHRAGQRHGAGAGHQS